MSARRAAGLWAAQRLTAAVLAVCVLVHLVTIIYAIRGGLSASEILGRTRGNYGWGAFYATFVLAAAVHGAIGLRAIAQEWLGIEGDFLEVGMTVVGVALAILGLRAVFAVVGA